MIHSFFLFSNSGEWFMEWISNLNDDKQWNSLGLAGRDTLTCREQLYLAMFYKPNPRTSRGFLRLKV